MYFMLWTKTQFCLKKKDGADKHQPGSTEYVHFFPQLFSVFVLYSFQLQRSLKFSSEWYKQAPPFLIHNYQGYILE